MSLITCVWDCVYQTDGYCSLKRAATCGHERGGCVHYVPGKGKINSKNGTLSGRIDGGD